jgi:hypothetical protein
MAERLAPEYSPPAQHQMFPGQASAILGANQLPQLAAVGHQRAALVAPVFNACSIRLRLRARHCVDHYS